MMNPSKTEANGGATLTSSAIRSKDFGTGITFSCCDHTVASVDGEDPAVHSQKVVMPVVSGTESGSSCPLCRIESDG